MSSLSVSRSLSKVEGNDKTKGKWDKKCGRPHDAGSKENATSYKKFNAVVLMAQNEHPTL